MMTESQIAEEKSYRYQERLGILAGSGNPNPEAYAIAREEVIEWERTYRAENQQQLDLMP